ncbi:MAG: hypothetical protein JNK04_06220 [Myxococcales bacterium]|nr:hypothetical protein [Myxococcales bacterium]
MKTVWLCGALAVGMSMAGVAHAEEAAGESGDPHVEAPAMQRRSPGLMAGGIVLVSVGSISTILGAAFLIGQNQAEDTCNKSSEIVVSTGGDAFDCSKNPTDTIAGVSLLAGGIATVAGGIPMIVIGKERVPETVAISLTPRLHGASVGMNVSF